MHLYNQFSKLKLALNYYTLSEMMSENENIDKYTSDIYKKIQNIINDGVLNFEVSQYEELVTRIDSIRKEITSHMEVVTAYVDRFDVFQYILNRIEYRFDEEALDNDYYNTKFTNDMMHYIISDKEYVNARISEIIRQLPVRITKNKFFERIKDAFSLYKDSEKQSFDEFIYMLRSVSMLYEPDGMKDNYSDLYEYYNKLMNLDYKNMTNEEYRDSVGLLNIAVEKVIKYSDIYIMLQEIVNDVFIIILSAPYNNMEEEKIAGVCDVIRELNNNNLDYEVLMEKFEDIEGVQEEMYHIISSNDYIIDEYVGNDILSGIMLDKQFNVLKTIAKLSTGSIFIELNDKCDDALTQEYMDASYDKLIKEFSELFEQVSNSVKRAVMSGVLASLPNFFSNIDELQEYINSSLIQCNDLAEKKACVSIIRECILFPNTVD